MKYSGIRRLTSAILAFSLVAQLIVIPPAAAKVRRELVEKRTRFTRTFYNGDGTYDFESFTTPIHYFDAASKRFEPVDATLEEATTTAGRRVWRNTANEFSFDLPTRLGKDWVSFETTQASVRYRPASRLNASPAEPRSPRARSSRWTARSSSTRAPSREPRSNTARCSRA